MMLSKREHDVYRLLIAHDFGLRSHEISGEIGVTYQRVYQLLKELKKKKYVRSGGGLWHAIRTAPKYGIKGEQAQLEDDGAEAMPIVRAFRGVGEWTAGAITAPNSVFDLARVA
jgi:hypothetical protein